MYRILLLAALFAVLLPAADELGFKASGYTTYGDWYAEATASPAAWTAGQIVRVSSKLVIGEQHLRNFANDRINIDGFALLVTAERTFDTTGWLRLASDDRLSTLLTPSGLPIEGGTQGAVTTRFGYAFKSPSDQVVRVPLTSAQRADGRIEAVFKAEGPLAEDKFVISDLLTVSAGLRYSSFFVTGPQTV